MSIMDQYTKFISEQVRKENGPLHEAASKGSVRMGDKNDTMHHVIHNDGKSNLTLHTNADGDHTTIHGKMHDEKTGTTHKINVKLHGDEHEGGDLKGALSDTIKERHPDLPSHIHKKIVNAAHKGWDF